MPPPDSAPRPAPGSVPGPAIGPTPGLTVFALLAAHAGAVRDRIENDATAHVDLLWKAADSIAQLVALLDRLAWHAGTLPSELVASCTAAKAANVELGRALDERAFMAAQRIDLSRQMADGVVLLLLGLDGAGAALLPEQLAAFYVSREQHAVHAIALARSNQPCEA